MIAIGAILGGNTDHTLQNGYPPNVKINELVTSFMRLAKGFWQGKLR